MDEVSASNPTFRVGSVFPASPRNVALLRFVVVVRQLVAFMRTMEALGEAATPGQREQRFFVLLATMACAKEATDAFLDADSIGCFDWMVSKEFEDRGLWPALTALRAAADRGDERSLYNRRLKSIRDQASWHWNRILVAEALTGLASDLYPVYEEAARPRDFCLPLVRDIGMGVSGMGHLQPDETKSELDKILVFQTQLMKIAHEAYFCQVQALSGET